jgi:PKD repeat protein
VEKLRVKGPLLLTLALALLLVVGVLYAGKADGAPLEADDLSLCQPVTDIELGYTPAFVYPGTAVLLAAESVSASLPLTFSWEFGDATAPISGTATSAKFTVTHTYSATGVYTVALTAWNTCTVAPLTVTVRVTVTSPPCVAPAGLGLTYTPTLAYTNTEVLFGGEVITGSLPVTYSWTFGDGTVPVTGTATAPAFTAAHTFTAAQVYTVSLAAWNVCTITPTQQGLTLAVSPCTAVSGVTATYWPAAARVGEVITFTAGLSGGLQPWAFEWAFGDGQADSGAVVTHAYTAPLTYTLTLTASNPCSRQVATATLRVAPSLWRAFVPLVGRQVPASPAAHLGYGANIAAADHVISLTVIGFDWAKGFVTWSDAGKGPNYNWVAVDNQLREFAPQVRNVLLRLGGPPPAGIGNPPVSASDLAAFSSFAQALAAHVSAVWRTQGLETAAYEIWNEPNLDYEWGGHPNAGQYTALLKVAYGGIKAGDPEAIVVSAGLATTGGSAKELTLTRQLYNAIQVVPDLTFLRNMYNNGAKGYLDALGCHPYGGPDAPDTPPGQASGPIYFRRAEEQHDIMLAYGDDSPVWATEFGWVLDTDCDLGEHNWMKVSEAQQAEYLAAAYAYADENWPWMGPMFLFNLDFATVDWYDDPCDPMRWYSITYRQDPDDPGHSPILPRQAFYSLRDAPKHSAW